MLGGCSSSCRTRIVRLESQLEKVLGTKGQLGTRASPKMVLHDHGMNSVELTGYETYWDQRTNKDRG